MGITHTLPTQVLPRKLAVSIKEGGKLTVTWHTTWNIWIVIQKSDPADMTSISRFCGEFKNNMR